MVVGESTALNSLGYLNHKLITSYQAKARVKQNVVMFFTKILHFFWKLNSWFALLNHCSISRTNQLFMQHSGKVVVHQVYN